MKQEEMTHEAVSPVPEIVVLTASVPRRSVNADGCVVEGTRVTVSLANIGVKPIGAVAVVNCKEVIVRSLCGLLVTEPDGNNGSLNVWTNTAVSLDAMRVYGFASPGAFCRWLTDPEGMVCYGRPKIATDSVPDGMICNGRPKIATDSVPDGDVCNGRPKIATDSIPGGMVCYGRPKIATDSVPGGNVGPPPTPVS